MGQRDAARGERGERVWAQERRCCVEVRGGGRKSAGRGGASTGKKTSSYPESEGGALEQVWPGDRSSVQWSHLIASVLLKHYRQVNPLKLKKLETAGILRKVVKIWNI